MSPEVMERQGELGQEAAKGKSSKDPNSNRSLVGLRRLPSGYYSHLACSEIHFSSHLFPGKTFAQLSSSSWGIQFLTKRSPLLTAAARVPAWSRTLCPQECLTMAEAQAAPPLPQP